MTVPQPVETAAPLEELTPLMRAFVEEYLVDLCATAAYRRAGGSAKSARVLGPTMLHDPRVHALVERRMVERDKESRVRSYRVREEVAVLAFSDLDHYRVTSTGRIRPTPDAPPGAMRAVARIKHTVIPQAGELKPIHKVEFSLWPKGPALEGAMRLLGMLDQPELPAAEPGDVARRVRDAVRAIIDADGLRDDLSVA